MLAILSDVHGNLEALTAVLADLERQRVRTVFNLGDTLGYGPDPLACLDLAQRMPLVLMGNFDAAVLTKPDGFCINAENSVLWTQSQLRVAPPEVRERRQAFLQGLPSNHQRDGVLFVHGSASNAQNEYVFPEDIYNERKMARIGAAFGSLCFAGHTHVPGLFREIAAGRWEYIHPEECSNGLPVAGSKLICNVGSVGQPRDEDERACYALFDGERIWYRRVDYDFEATIQKIYAVPELANFLGDRLREGR